MEGTSRRFRRFSVITVAVTYLLIVVGGIVRVSGSGEGCGSADGTDSWPLCHGSIVPPADLQTVIEFSHRMLVTITTVCIAALAVWALLRYRHIVSIAAASVLCAVLLVIQIILGWATVQFELPGGIVLAHLANAELILATATFVAIRSYSAGTDNTDSAWRVAVVLAAATFLLVLSGANVVAQGAGAACDGWPLCAGHGGFGFGIPSQGLDAVNVLHRFVAGVVVLLLGGGMVWLRRQRRGDLALSRTVVALNVILLLQIIAGALVVELRLPAFFRGVHLALASALWLAVVTVAFLVRFDVRSAQPGHESKAATDVEAVPA